MNDNQGMRGRSFTAAPGLALLAPIAVSCLAGSILLPEGAAAEDPCRSDQALFEARVLESFEHRRGDRGDRHLPETMGAGAAWVDRDGDGLLDLFLVQSGELPGSTSTAGTGNDSGAHGHQLLANRGRGRLVPVPGVAPSDTGYGQGVLAVDVDGDRDRDLVLAHFGGTELLINQAGSFELASDRLTDPTPSSARPWSSAIAAGDLNGDAWIDLYVVHYLDYDEAADLFCGDRASGRRDYCDPALFEGQADRLLINRGDGHFVDRSQAAGLAGARGKGLGVLLADLDGDRHLDIYVANDLTPNFLFRGRGDGTFDDVSLLSGAAVDAVGKPEAGMGLALFDAEGDGDPDLAVTNFDVETNTLYRNLGGLFFDDASAASGFGPPSFNRLGFGLVAGDFNLDGAIDLFVANGHIFERPARENVSFAQPDALLLGNGQGGFEASPCVVADFSAGVSRAAAGADFDNDGDLDLLVTENGGSPVLLINRREAKDAWLGVALEGRSPNTESLGAQVTLEWGADAGGAGEAARSIARRWVIAGGSYQASSDRRQLFGLGEAGQRPSAVEVAWPDGRKRRVLEPPAGRYLHMVESR